VMELCRRWYPAEYNKAPRKRNAHTALSDIQDSIRQLRHYRYFQCCGWWSLRRQGQRS
jgi:oligoribonuclease (3'-5' exoribonuclease)